MAEIDRRRCTPVMRGLVPHIHVFLDSSMKTWMAATSAAMTAKDVEQIIQEDVFLSVSLFQKVLTGGRSMRGGSVYILTNRPNGVLYIGVTSDLAGRIFEHRIGLYPGFTKRYGLKLLVWHDEFDTIEAAIQREKTMKHWPRAWKVRTIMAMNPEWKDLYEEVSLH